MGGSDFIGYCSSQEKIDRGEAQAKEARQLADLAGDADADTLGKARARPFCAWCFCFCRGESLV